MARIVITEFMNDGAVDLLRSQHEVLYDPNLAEHPQALLDTVSDAAALIVRNRTLVTAELLSRSPELKVVGRLGVGLDNIDLEGCAAHHVAVRPATGANAVAVAEYVIGALLVLIRGVFDATPLILQGGWPRQQLRGGELSGRTLGLIGYGTIAREVALRASALGMSVLAHDPFLPDKFAWQPARPMELTSLLAEADAISIHVPLVPETRHLVDAGALAVMRPESVLINTSRGGVVDEVALSVALRTGQIGAAALDVFEDEPPMPDRLQALSSAPNLILTPHIAGVTDESDIRVGRVVAEAVLQELSDG